MDRLADMISSQHKLQVALGNDITEMTPEQRITYVKDQVLALQSEIGEFLNEVGWKPWASSRHINADEAFGELRDAWQFLTNLMIAVTGMTNELLAAKLETELYRKHTVNYQRIGAYDGVSTKCPDCKRALDDPGATCTYMGCQYIPA
jgi:dimeric dUTPase (all-alpha-NTP-PPase superfamily)